MSNRNVTTTFKEIQKNRILNLLDGSVQPSVKVKRIAWVADVAETCDTCPATRGLIKELIHEGHLIGSTNDGYMLMSTAKEVQVYLNSLLKRQMGISRRIQAVHDAAQRMGVL